MRSFIVIAMFVASLTLADLTAAETYEKVRDLELDAGGISLLSIEAGAGSMDVTGVDGLDKIVVKATIVVPDTDEEDALKVIKKNMTLSLEQKNSEAKLNAWFDKGFMGLGSNAHIVLDVSVAVHTGELLVGTIGSADRHEYTVIGDTVNVAARLQQFSKERGGGTVISEATYESAREAGMDVAVGAIESVTLRGRTEPVAVYILE